MSAPSVTKFNWTPEHIERGLKLIAEGRSSGDIAKEFGTTRNCIVGKLTRERIKRGLHIPNPKGPLSQKRQSPRREVTKPNLVIISRGEPIEDSPPVVMPMIEKGTGTPCDIVELKGCKWPLHADEKAYGGHIFCNAARPINMPYCETHRRMACEKYKTWSLSDDAKIREEWNLGRGKDRLSQILNRPKTAVMIRAKQLGLSMV